MNPLLLICCKFVSLQLPDYHDIIENPMDFGTVRKKLDGGAYANLEQFEVGFRKAFSANTHTNMCAHV